MTTSANEIRFSKMHGIGNDFVIIDAIHQTVPLNTLQQSIATLADRHLGIGFDQILLIEPAEKADFFCRIFNSDGSEATQCGNGLRCVARFVYEKGYTSKRIFHLATKAGIYALQLQDEHLIKMTMGIPAVIKNTLSLEVNTVQPQSLTMSILSVGNLHAILKVDASNDGLAATLGPAISTHTYFPNGVNVGFMQIMNPHHIRLRTFERGAGLTHACGSNACAAAATGMIHGWLTHPVKVEYTCGSLLIDWQGEGHPIHLTGPATLVFDGKITL